MVCYHFPKQKNILFLIQCFPFLIPIKPIVNSLSPFNIVIRLMIHSKLYFILSNIIYFITKIFIHFTTYIIYKSVF